MSQEQTCSHVTVGERESLNLALYFHGASETPSNIGFPTISGVIVSDSLCLVVFTINQNRHTCSTFLFFWNDWFLCCYHLSTESGMGINVHSGLEEAVRPL